MGMNSAATESTNTKEVIDEHLFVEALALTSFEIPFKEPQPDTPEKVLSIYIILK